MGSVLGLCRCWLGKQYCYSDTWLEDKVVIITGANTGIGKETARELGRRGARVILACRDLNRAEEAATELKMENGGEYLVKYLDLAKLETVRKFAEEIKETEPKVHFLINNAGVMMCPKWTTEDGFEMHFGVNHLGHFLLTLLLLQPLRNAAPSRVITVSSVAHMMGRLHWEDLNLDTNYNARRAYCQSKLANILFAKEFGRRLDGTGVTTYSLHPGVVHTELGRYMNLSTNKVIAWGFRFFGSLFFKTPWQGAQTTLYCALDKTLTSSTGKYYSDCRETIPWSNALDDESASRLWQVSLDLLGVHPDPTIGMFKESNQFLAHISVS